MLMDTRNPYGRGLVDCCARFITPHEVQLMQRFCHLRRHAWLTGLFRCASRLGDGLLWWATSLGLLAGGGTAERRAVAAMALALLASVLLFKAVKHLIGRPRPFVTWPNLVCLAAVPDRFSFPSGHTMTAFAACTAFGELLPGSILLFFPAAVLIGLSRVFLGLHYPTDVLVGALLGTGIGLGCAKLATFLLPL